MTDHRIVTDAVIQLVEDYVYTELCQAEKSTNGELFDESGIFSLHRLAAHIYAYGFSDGERIATEKARHGARRARERREKAADV